MTKDVSSVPLYGGGNHFKVVVISETLSVVCTNSVTISCQAVEIRGGNQTLIGVSKEVATYQDFLDIELESSANGEYVLVCYSTYSFGAKCTTLGVDKFFGLLQTEQQHFVCNVGEICQHLALSRMPNAVAVDREFVLCFAGGESSSYCTRLAIMRVGGVQKSIQVTRELTVAGEVWASTSLFPASRKELMLCTVLVGTLTQTAKCRLLDTTPTGLTLLTRNVEDIHGVSVISGAYLGALQGIQFSIVCYLQLRAMTCRVVFVNAGVIIRSSSATFAAQYTGLDGLRIQSLTDNQAGADVLSCMICFSSIEDSTELICTLATVVGRSGRLQLDPYEMVVDSDGFYFQNVEQALRVTEVVGGYLETSLKRGKDPISGSGSGSLASAYIADVTVLPDFFGTFNRTDNQSSIASVGCVSVGFHDFDTARYCIGTRTKMPKLKPSTSMVIPPDGYCGVTQTWECNARGDKCMQYNNRCTSRYDCSVASASRTACNAFANQGALCKWDVDSSLCVPSYDWDADTMCSTITAAARCNANGFGCGWFANSCHALPYCEWPSSTACLAHSGCVWVGQRCGKAA